MIQSKIDLYQWYLNEGEYIISLQDNSIVTSEHRNIFFVNNEDFDLALDWTNNLKNQNKRWHDFLKKEMLD